MNIEKKGIAQPANKKRPVSTHTNAQWACRGARQRRRTPGCAECMAAGMSLSVYAGWARATSKTAHATPQPPKPKPSTLNRLCMTVLFAHTFRPSSTGWNRRMGSTSVQVRSARRRWVLGRMCCDGAGGEGAGSAGLPDADSGTLYVISSWCSWPGYARQLGGVVWSGGGGGEETRQTHMIKAHILWRAC